MKPFLSRSLALHGSPGEAAAEWVSSGSSELQDMQQGRQAGKRPSPLAMAKAGRMPSTLTPPDSEELQKGAVEVVETVFPLGSS